MTARVPIPAAAHRSLTELWAEIDDGHEPENIYDVDDLILALDVMAQEGDEDAAIAHRWLKDHHDQYFEGLANGFEPT